MNTMNGLPLSGFTLLQKALALVFIPFVFNCVWLLILSHVSSNAQHLADMERQQSRFIENLNAVLKDSYQTRENFIGFIATSGKGYLGRADFWIDKTQHDVIELKSLPELTSDQLNLVGELEEIIIDQSKLIRDVLRHSRGDSKLGLLEDVAPMSDSLDSVLNKYPDTEAHLSTQRKGLESARLDAKESASLAQRTLIFGLSGNLVLTLLLVLAIRKDLAKRLNLLMENTKRLPLRQTLNDPIAGSDELVSLDQSLHAASAELAKSAKFRSALMQMVAHDLRSPLTSCLVGVDLFTSASLSEREVGRIAAIKNSLTRVIDLTDDLLLIEQFESAKFPLVLEPENMQELVAHACAGLAGLAHANHVGLKNETAVEYVVADRKRILQVLVNYLSNAIKFSPPDSTIVVSSAKSKRALKVLVQDSGPGVALEEQDKIFERFFQAKEGKSAGGTGLGLAISKVIIEAHGGSVGLVSKPGEGATFWFSIPITSNGSDDIA